MAKHIHVHLAPAKTVDRKVKDFDFSKAPFYILKQDTRFPMKLGWKAKSNMANPDEFYVSNGTVFYQVSRGKFVPYFAKSGTPFAMSESMFVKQTRDAKRTKAEINEELADVLEMLKEAENDGSPASEVRALEREVAKLRAELLKTKDADWSTRHVGNFRFEVTTPQGKKISIGHAETSAEAIEKAKKLPAGATHDVIDIPTALLGWGRKKNISQSILQSEYSKWLKNQQEQFPKRSPYDQKIAAITITKQSLQTYGAKDSATGNSSFTGTEFGWKNKVKDSYPAASFRIRPAGKIVAKVGDKDVGEYDKQKGAGTIVDKTEDEQYKGYELKEFQPGKWMAKKGFSHFGPATSLQELKTKLDKHLAQIAKGGSAP